MVDLTIYFCDGCGKQFAYEDSVRIEYIYHVGNLEIPEMTKCYHMKCWRAIPEDDR